MLIFAHVIANYNCTESGEYPALAFVQNAREVKMAGISNILAVYDPTRRPHLAEQPAVARAGELASTLGANLEIFLCDYNQYISGDRFFDSPGLKKARESYVESRRAPVKQLAEELSKKGLSVSTTAVWDSPLSDGIVRGVLKSRPDLVIKDTHPHAKLQRVIFTNTDWHLVRDCPVPLLLVKPSEGNPHGPVIVSVDPMNDNDKPALLDHKLVIMGQEISKAMGSRLHLFHAYPAIVAAPSGVPVGIEPVALPVNLTDEKIAAAHKREFRMLAKKFGVPDEQSHLVQGSPRDELFEVVEKLGASMVIMGAVARGPLQRIFIGSTAERVLGDVPCDVLVVKPDGFESPVKA